MFLLKEFMLKYMSFIVLFFAVVSNRVSISLVLVSTTKFPVTSPAYTQTWSLFVLITALISVLMQGLNF